VWSTPGTVPPEPRSRSNFMHTGQPGATHPDLTMHWVGGGVWYTPGTVLTEPRLPSNSMHTGQPGAVHPDLTTG